MALLDTPLAAASPDTDGNLLFSWAERSATLHAQWLRHRSEEIGQIEPTNRQRLFTPLDIDPHLVVQAAEQDGEAITVSFSDGHRARLAITQILQALGWQDDPEEPPAGVAWTEPLADFPYVDWSSIGWDPGEQSDAAMIEFLGAFFTHGYVVLRNTPAEVGTVERIANRLGYLVGNNFGAVFDVRSEPNPTDLAYTSLELLAHTDQPYRQPPPGIQMLHCIANEAPGGDSTLVDGLACFDQMRRDTPELFEVMCGTEVIYRYDMGTDTVVDRGYTFELDNMGRFRRLRFNTKLDEPVLTGVGAQSTGSSGTLDTGTLDAYYEGRRWLAQWLNDPAHQVTFRLEPGDVMFMDNHRVLHGRTAFDPSRGRRHLQGGYIDHDRPDTLYRLAVRSERASN